MRLFISAAMASAIVGFGVPGYSRSQEEAPTQGAERRAAVREDLGTATGQRDDRQSPDVDLQELPAEGRHDPSVRLPEGDVRTDRGLREPAADVPLRSAPGAMPHRATNENAWRYRWHNNKWWYWLPSNRWVIWSDRTWVPYDSYTRRAPHTTRYDGYDNAHYGKRSYRNRYPDTRTHTRYPGSLANEYGRPDVRGKDIEGGGGQGIGGPLGSREEAGSIHAGGGASAGQGSGTSARANLGTFGTAGGQIGGSGAGPIPTPTELGARERPGVDLALPQREAEVRARQLERNRRSAGEEAFRTENGQR
jgi:hypothetical protein